MPDKQEDIEQASAAILVSLQDVTQMEPGDILNAMRRFMDAKELQMFDLAHFCEQETIKAQEVGAHLATCLMSAAMNEALLALMCLKYEADVIATNQYKSSIRKKSRSFRDVIADWSFEQFIKVAEENEWVPAEIVREEFKIALADSYRELMPITHPMMTEEEIAQGAQAFFQYPGTAMLRVSQDLRNSIHAGRWMRGKSTLVAEHFTNWCQFATIVGGEIRTCLMHLIMQRDAKTVQDKVSELNEMLNELPPAFRAFIQEQVRAKLKG